MYRILSLQNYIPYTDDTRYQTLLATALANHLRQTHDVEHDVLLPRPHALQSGYDQLSFAGITCPRAFYGDVIIVERKSDGRFIVIDAQDYPSFSPRLAESPLCDLVFMTMYTDRWFTDGRERVKHKFRPFLYFPLYPVQTYQYSLMLERPNSTELDDRLFFAGTIGREPGSTYVARHGDELVPWRAVVDYLQALAPDEIVVLDGTQKLDRPEFWKRAMRHRWSLFLPGHPWCSREHELWTLGIPTIGFVYPDHPLMYPIVPNSDYAAAIAVGGQDVTGRPLDPAAAAKSLLTRFREVRHDDDFAARVAARARARMDTLTFSFVAKSIIEQWATTTYN